MRNQSAIHTSLRGAQWVNAREGSNREIDGTYDSQVEAATAARRLARQEQVEHISHRADGFIDEITSAGQ